MNGAGKVTESEPVILVAKYVLLYACGKVISRRNVHLALLHLFTLFLTLQHILCYLVLGRPLFVSHYKNLTQQYAIFFFAVKR